MKSNTKKALKKFLPWFVMLLVVAAIGLTLKTSGPTFEKPQAVYSEVLAKVQAGAVSSLVFQGENVIATLKDNTLMSASVPVKEQELISSAIQNDVRVQNLPLPGPSGVVQFLNNWGPLLLIFCVLIFMARARNGAPKLTGGPFSNGKSKARLMAAGENVVLFTDIAGCDEAKAEVSGLVDYLRDPGKFQKLGGRIPRGVLLEGPPGTGKTQLARAIANEAKVPFFSIAGSDFIEMLVGVGSARVRDLFREAKSQAPCIVFIDEIDAVGRKRSNGQGGTNSEQEQTLNQLLVEMDGFNQAQGVIVIAATNRSDILDSALLRPGRFDRQVVVGLPDVRGREQILAVHLKKVTTTVDIDILSLAKGTPGFSGADLANLVNEAALAAATANKQFVEMADLERAKDKQLMGSERHSLRMSESEKSDTAYHEAGHTLIAKLLKYTDPIHKVSIIPRGRALGVTVQLPESDRYSLGQKRILDSIAMLFGGRVAEELYTDDITTGASNDYERATAMARSMVAKWGMSKSIGPVVIPSEGCSEATLQAVDSEVKRILEEQYARVLALLQKHKDAMVALHDELMQHETLDSDDIDAVLAQQPSAPLLARHAIA